MLLCIKYYMNHEPIINASQCKIAIKSHSLLPRDDNSNTLSLKTFKLQFNNCDNFLKEDKNKDRAFDKCVNLEESCNTQSEYLGSNTAKEFPLEALL